MGWIRLLVQVQKDLRLWLLLVGILAGGRVAILLGLHGSWDPATGLADLFWTAARGLRFDMQLATLWCVAPLAMSIACAFTDCARAGDRLRQVLALAFAILWSCTTVVDIGFFLEYHDQFDHFLFGALYDDQQAIIATVWKTYHPLRYVAGALAGGILTSWILWRGIRRPFASGERLARSPWPLTWRVAVGVMAAALLVVTARGSLARRPLQMKDAAVVADRCLDAWVPTPFHALSSALNTWQEMQGINGIDNLVPGGDLPAAAAAAFPELGRRGRVEDYLLRTAPGCGTTARHVVLLIMESFDAWPLEERWRPLHLTDQVAALGQDGILVTDFVSIGNGTMPTLAGILTGFPDVGVYTAYRPSVRQSFPSSPAAIFKRLGYRTNFFYAGYLSWQRIGDFCSDQGFDHVYGGGHIGNPSGNEWGVEDEDLFAYALKTVDDDAPSFSVILTTSNHPPFQVDVDRKGFPLRTIPAWTQHDPAGGFTREILGHLWYSDRCAGDFIRAVERKLPRTVVALTGDHWSRRSMTATPSAYERCAVPLLLHGPQVLAQLPRPAHPVGGHLDIAPTLIELCAPAGFTYHALGGSLLRDHRGLGLGPGRVMGPGFVMEMDRDPPGIFPASAAVVTQDVVRWYQACQGLGWWRLMRGAGLEPTSH